jgi:hypothetical protein
MEKSVRSASGRHKWRPYGFCRVRIYAHRLHGRTEFETWLIAPGNATGVKIFIGKLILPDIRHEQCDRQARLKRRNIKPDDCRS